MGRPLPCSICSWHLWALLTKSLRGWVSAPARAPAPGCPALLGPGEGGHLIKKMELPQAPCLNSCSAVMTNSSSQGLRSRGGALSHLCSQGPQLPGDQLPGHSLAPSWGWGAARASRAFPSQKRLPAPLLPACSSPPPPSS